LFINVCEFKRKKTWLWIDGVEENRPKGVGSNISYLLYAVMDKKCPVPRQIMARENETRSLEALMFSFWLREWSRIGTAKARPHAAKLATL
jgi:hypothetical protein